MHKAFLRQEENSSTFQLPQHYPAARFSLCMAVSVSHFSSCLWFPFGTARIHPGKPTQRPPAHPTQAASSSPTKLRDIHNCSTVSRPSLLSYVVKTGSPSKPPFTPAKTYHLSSAQQHCKAKRHLLESTCSVLWCMNTTPRFFRFCRRKDRNTGSARQERIKMNSNTIIQSGIWSQNQAKDN